MPRGKDNCQPPTGRVFVTTGVQLENVAEQSTTTLFDTGPLNKAKNVPFETVTLFEMKTNGGTHHLAV
jgi:hypothetical protein